MVEKRSGPPMILDEEVKADEGIRVQVPIKWNKCNKKLPLAPTLEDFLLDGSEKKYFPRPEWCRRPCRHANIIADVPGNLESFRSTSTSTRTRYREQDEVVGAVGNVNEDMNADDVIIAPENGLLPEQSNWGSYFPPRRSPVLQSYYLHDVLPLPIEETALAFAQSSIFRVRFPRNTQENDSRRTETSEYFPNYSSVSIEVDHHDGKRTRTQSRGAPVAPLFGSDGNSALHVAIEASNISVYPSLSLICLGADTNFQNRRGITPIILASEKGYLEIVKALFHRGANPLVSSDTGTTPLMQACRNGHLETVSFLLKRGVLPNQTDHRKVTALMIASQIGHEVSAMSILIDPESSFLVRNLRIHRSYT